LANGDAGNFGTTVHLVDAGVDTGATLAITRIADASKDTMLTYPLLMAAHSRAACISAIKDALNGTLKPIPASGPSAQRFHPPIWSYLWTGLTRGIW
jgi:methionyl-tRNA formyltransferase